jgi:hypothetical protein
MASMASPDRHEPDPQPLPVRPPYCPRCFAQMRLVRIVPHEHFGNLDDRLFACDCGEQVSDTAERLD